MIQFNPNERINLNDVINSDFMKGNLDDNKSVIDELSQRENIVKKQLETQNKESTSISTSSSSSSSSKKLKMARKCFLLTAWFGLRMLKIKNTIQLMYVIII